MIKYYLKKYSNRCLTAFIYFLFTSAYVYAQNGNPPFTTTDTAKSVKGGKGSSAFKFGVNYLSNSVYMGRTDTVTTPIILPEVKYTLKNGIYFSGNLDIIPNRQKNKLDGGDIAGGYEFDIGENLSGSASFTKTFYSATSTQLNSSVRGIFNGNLTYDIGTIISPSLSLDYDINKQGINNDGFVNFGLSHDFIVVGVFGKKDVFLISPTASLNAGTQNFYDGYISARQLKSLRANAAQTVALNRFLSQLSQFELLDYEFSAPLEYKTGHFIFQFTPTYAVVENQLPPALATRLPSKPSVFYFETGISFKF